MSNDREIGVSLGLVLAGGTSGICGDVQATEVKSTRCLQAWGITDV
jgi:hypothetical protein